MGWIKTFRRRVYINDSGDKYNLTLHVTKDYWIKNPPDLISTYLLASIDGVQAPTSLIQFSDAFTTNTSCSPYQLSIYERNTATEHPDLELFKNVTTNMYSIRVKNKAYFLTE